MWSNIEEGFRRLREFTSQLWVSIVLFSLSGVLLAIFANRLSGLLPDGLDLDAAADSVGALLNVLTTSMLTVTTFSLTIVRGTMNQVATTATPRAIRLVGSDPISRDALGTFVGSFLFGIFGIVGLSAGYYNEKGQVILFLATLLVVVLVTWKLVRWISATPDMGTLDDTIERIELVTKKALTAWRDSPALGCSCVIDSEEGRHAVYGDRSGHIYHISFNMLQDRAEKLEARIALEVQPGALVHKGMVVAWIIPDQPGAQNMESKLKSAAEDLVDAFEVRTAHNLDIDPYSGITALSEIASRALSPAVNDPGTAISVIECGVRSFDVYMDRPQEGERTHDRVQMADLDFGKLLRVFFDPIARDGAGIIEVQMALQGALKGLAARALSNSDGDKQDDERRARLVQECSVNCLERANQAMGFEPDRKLLAKEVSASWK